MPTQLRVYVWKCMEHEKSLVHFCKTQGPTCTYVRMWMYKWQLNIDEHSIWLGLFMANGDVCVCVCVCRDMILPTRQGLLWNGLHHKEHNRHTLKKVFGKFTLNQLASCTVHLYVRTVLTYVCMFVFSLCAKCLHLTLRMHIWFKGICILPFLHHREQLYRCLCWHPNSLTCWGFQSLEINFQTKKPMGQECTKHVHMYVCVYYIYHMETVELSRASKMDTVTVYVCMYR
jgi:hypothetical protein